MSDIKRNSELTNIGHTFADRVRQGQITPEEARQKQERLTGWIETESVDGKVGVVTRPDAGSNHQIYVYNKSSANGSRQLLTSFDSIEAMQHWTEQTGGLITDESGTVLVGTPISKILKDLDKDEGGFVKIDEVEDAK